MLFTAHLATPAQAAELAAPFNAPPSAATLLPAKCDRDHAALKADPVAFAKLDQIGTQPTHDKHGQPDVLMLANCSCGSTLAREVFSTPVAKPIVEEIEWVGRDEAIVTWAVEPNGVPIVSSISVEFDEQHIADGDAPRSILDRVEAEAVDFLDYDEDVDLDDGPGYANESHYGGAL